MAFAAKYTAECYSETDGKAIKVEIQYDGASNTDVNFAFPDPVIISQVPAEDGIYQPIIGSECRVKLMCTTFRQFSEFFDAAYRDYKLVVYYDSTEVWNGYLLPDAMEELYTYPPYPIEIVAGDSLGDLKNIKFEAQSSPGNLSTRIRLDTIVSSILGKVGYASFNDFTGLEETAITIDPFETYADTVGVFCDHRDIEENPSCYTVLEGILRSLGARLMQCYHPDIDSSPSGLWFIYRPAYFRQSSLSGKFYQYTVGNTAKTITNHIKTVSGKDAAWASINAIIDGTPVLRAIPGAKGYDVKLDYGYKNVIRDGYFSTDDITDNWYGWNFTLSDATHHVYKIKDEKELVYYHMSISSWGKLNEDVIRDFNVLPRFAVHDTYGIDYTDRCLYVPGGSSVTDSGGLSTDNYVEYLPNPSITSSGTANYLLHVKWEQKYVCTTTEQKYTSLYVKYVNSGSTRWLDEDGNWQSSQCAIQFEMTPNKWGSYEIFSALLPTSGTSEITVYCGKVTHVSASGGTISGTYFNNIEIFIERSGASSMPMSDDYSETLNSDNNVILKDVYPVGDVDEYGSEKNIYVAPLSNSSLGGTATSEWQASGKSHKKKLIELTVDWLRVTMRQPLTVLRGSFYGNNNFATIYRDSNLGKDFFTNFAEWNLAKNTWTGEFVELPDVQNESTNLITGWTNTDWGTHTDSGDSFGTLAASGAGQVTISNSITWDSGEELYVSWSASTHTGGDTEFALGGQTVTMDDTSGGEAITPSGTSGTATLTSAAGDDYWLSLTVYVYRRYGY